MGISVKHLEKWHPGGGAPVLKGLSFNVEKGAIAAVMGRSGAGKSSLLRCLTGLDPFDAGEIEVGGLRVTGTRDGDAHRELRRSLTGAVGMVFQSLELFPHMTVLENCLLAPTVVKLEPRAAAEERARHWLAALDVEDKAGMHPGQLSGGQRQRVAIARALTMQPRVLVYDEPTSALDKALKMEVCRVLERVQREGITQLMVVHDEDVARTANVVMVMEAGAVARQGRPADVL